jgi:hypothetical protein
MQLKLEAGDDAKVAAAAAKGPEKVAVVFLAGATTRPSAVTTSADTGCRSRARTCPWVAKSAAR